MSKKQSVTRVTKTTAMVVQVLGRIFRDYLGFTVVEEEWEIHWGVGISFKHAVPPPETNDALAIQSHDQLWGQDVFTDHVVGKIVINAQGHKRKLPVRAVIERVYPRNASDEIEVSVSLWTLDWKGVVERSQFMYEGHGAFVDRCTNPEDLAELPPSKICWHKDSVKKTAHHCSL